MNHPLLRYLCCPACKKTLKHTRTRFTCHACNTVFPVRYGIPILVDLANLHEHLRGQVEYFEKEDATRRTYTLEAWQKRYVNNFLKARPKTRGHIVDCATGSGYMAIELAKRGFRVIATDLTLAELIKLKANIQKFKITDRVLLVCANSEELPIRTYSADGLIANAILEHLPREEKAVSEITRVLKPHSPLMLAVPIRLGYVWPFLWPVNIWHDKRIGHLRRYTRSSILSLFSGFSEMFTYYTGNLGKIACMILRLHKWGEKIDVLTQRLPYGSSNIVSILRKL